MTVERFDIEVRDLVAKTIRTELKAIGTEARGTHTLVQQLNRELSAGARAAAAGAQTAANTASSAAARTASAQAKATAESARAAAQMARTEAAQRKANIAYLQEEAALNRAIAAEQRAIASKQRLAAASNQAAAAAQREIRITQPTGIRPANPSSLGGMSGSRETVANQNRIMGVGVPREATAGVEENSRSLQGNAAAADRAGAAQTAFASRTAAAGASARMSSQHTANLVFQLNDVFVSLASGQNPMMVFIQQGSQVGQIAQQAGISYKEMGMSILQTLKIIERTTDAEAAAELASASLATRNLASSAAAAAANVAQADTEIALATAQRATATTAAQVTAAEARLATAHEAAAAAAAQQTVAENALATAQGRQATAAGNASKLTTTRLGSVGRVAGPLAVILATAAAGVAAVNREANNTTSMQKYAQSLGLTAKEIKKLDDVTITYGDTAKAVFQVGIRNIANRLGIDTDKISDHWNNMLNFMARNTRRVLAGLYASFAGAAYGINNIAQNMGNGKSDDNPFSNVIQGYKEAYADAQQFFDDVSVQATTNARNRIRQQAQDEGMLDPEKERKKRERKGAQGFDRAKELASVNAELDSQISLLKYYGDELERQTQLEAIARRFREEGVPLTAAENAALMEKITLIQDGVRVQQAMTAAEEAANGPSRELATTQDALNRLLEAGAINHAEHNRQLRMAERAFEDATDPLAAMNRELEKQGNLISHFGRSRGLREYIDQLKEAAEAQGKTIYANGGGSSGGSGDEIVVTGSKRYTPEVQRMIDEFQRQKQVEEMTSAFERIDPEANRDVGGTAYILDNYRNMYEEIQRFRDEDVRNEEEAARRKANLDRTLRDARLETASDLFGQLASLQSSSNRKVAALGKAAAIAQATIDGYRAVQSALAGPPGPPWSFAIAGVTGAMTAMNVARIAGVGFQRGGYTGDGYAGDVAGPAHKREYVFDASATARIGVPALDALRRGTLNPPPSNDNRAVNVIVKPEPGVFVEERRTPEGDIEMIARRIVRSEGPKAVADNIRGNPNSETSKALSGAYGLKRAR